VRSGVVVLGRGDGADAIREDASIGVRARQTIANASCSATRDRWVHIENHLGSVEVIVDVSGYFAPH
jgi:hypothetical protein